MKINIENSKHAKIASKLFKEGYSCAQSTFLAFNEYINLSFEDASKLSSSFGAGMGRLREVCGALTGIFMAAGFMYAKEDPKDIESKTEHYARIQYFASEFKKHTSCNSFICRDLLNLDIDGADKPRPQTRDKKYYEERPCEELVMIAAVIYENYISEHEPNNSLKS